LAPVLAVGIDGGPGGRRPLGHETAERVQAAEVGIGVWAGGRDGSDAGPLVGNPLVLAAWAIGPAVVALTEAAGEAVVARVDGGRLSAR
jgi:hypothetical protein